MLITCITHAHAKEDTFRALTKQGTLEANSAAEKYRELARSLVKSGSYQPDALAIDCVVSSPLPRCLETVILFAKELSEYCNSSQIQIDNGLRAGGITGRSLAELVQNLAAESSVKHVLVSLHADLARALPERARLDLEASEAVKNGWFQMRPVMVMLDYPVGQGTNSWEDAKILSCEGTFHSPWKSLL
jgi:phosphohistidine phosphatase SixA